MRTQKTRLSMRDTKTKHIAAIDVFRAITMFLMLFVNDIPGLRNVPRWLMHADVNEDMMGFSDTIFPAFLFCVGLSIPFAIRNRQKKGESDTQILTHIIKRSIALITMGLFSLNSGGAGALSHQWFTILMAVAFFLVWNAYPEVSGARRHVITGMKALGVAILAFLVIYKDIHGKPFQQGWWGILGLIGWTYAVCAIAYLFTQGNFRRNALAWLAMVALSVLNHSNIIPAGYGIRAILLPFVPGDWTLHALGFSGIMTSLLLMKNKERPTKFIGILCGLGITAFLLGLWSHHYWIISKIQATPTWLFYCLAMYFPIFGAIYWLTDMKGKTSWFNVIKPAGTATLTCYTLPYIWYAIWQLAGLRYPPALQAGIPGLLKALAYSLVIVCLAGLLSKMKVKLKL